MDEIIIVDTGSTDHTKQIASEYTDLIYDYEWQGDFSAARNFAFSKAGCDYIFSADADEYIDEKNLKALQILKQCLLPEIEIVQMKYVNISDFRSVYNCKKELRPKLFRRQREFTWISPIHETVRLLPLVFDSDVEIFHMPQHDNSSRDFKTYINAINNGVRLENYSLIMFCKELMIVADDDVLLSVRDLFEQTLIMHYHDKECIEAMNCVLARIYRLSSDFNSFFKICINNVSSHANSEICNEIGLYFIALKDYKEAVMWFNNAAYNSKSILDIHSQGDAPLYNLAFCYEQLANIESIKGNTELSLVYESNSKKFLTLAKEWTLPEEL